MALQEEVSIRLLTKAQEAVLQLDLWIKDQQGFQNRDGLRASTSESLEQAERDYNRYMFQLNSLYLRAQYIRDKIEKQNAYNLADSDVAGNDTNSHAYVQQLVTEFYSLSIKMNELSAIQENVTNGSSPLSNKSSHSNDSLSKITDGFQPRPLKILQRQKHNNNQNTHPQPDLESPLKLKHRSSYNKLLSSNKKESKPYKNFNSKKSKNNELLSDISPVKIQSFEEPTFSVANTRNKNSMDPLHYSLFKTNNRLSIQFPDGYDNDDEYDDPTCISDQDTIFVSTPKIASSIKNTSEPLRKFNSHESILSVEKSNMKFIQPLPALKPPSSLLNLTLKKNLRSVSSVSSNNVSLTYNPMISKLNTTTIIPSEHTRNQMRVNSVDLLNLYVQQPTPKKLKTESQSPNPPSTDTLPSSNKESSVFSNWNILNLISTPRLSISSSVTNTQAASTKAPKPIKNKPNYGDLLNHSNEFHYEPPLHYQSNLQTHNQNTDAAVISRGISVSDLEHALNTNLKL
ncbi:hypothetical protein TBLA_0A07580 [Henningerozyma blattae CBS 6284]|uniref:Uncharacterized protein n=1 Tax=Henningerozyma blattae (strain ATCC 34711 / CBS 6284 / DSM 70876 / NBRC 10599 / NRRL Y-10934 / UCD 77-7) TaxID=1071380 RepID=I2GWP6_HENB6|nr:hypothetical protein TBLA_0A07580 [Tetrapisispora blattae CBS 6284]CCH58548.1 hypothetical protein TBLA_0A07580 [Tetrapisispora blattae CBS 6284]